ncbi:unnamed protein product [Callosobruchus maculatus]|uniref:C2H2-type domain-containing protein n=1 Tax=Callosobruchus maculatus TaxID=64391 RepID=A0A653DGG4_CALMS|nr:unnamed protein product [Callosobruchus maculatus]
MDEQFQPSLPCRKCEKTFSDLSILRKHVKTFHSGEDHYLESLQKKVFKAKKIDLVYCECCGKSFNKKSNLNRHLSIHVDELKKSKLGKAAALGVKSVNDERCLVIDAKKHICEYCGRSFSDRSNLTRHLKIHVEESQYSSVQPKSKFNKRKTGLQLTCPITGEPKKDKCTLCDFSAERRFIIKHYKEDHRILLREKKYFFTSLEDFFTWMKEYESETNAKFIKDYNVTKKSAIYKGFKCHRSGSYESVSKGLRNIKTQGSVKIGGFCPASIKLKNNETAGYDVAVVETHVGHDLEIRHLRLNKEEREYLARKIAANIPFDDILEEISSSISDAKLKRLHILNKKDLYNIAASFNLCPNTVRCSNDIMSMDSWISDMQINTTSILFYKPEGIVVEEWNQLKEDDFILIVMTESQSQILQSHGTDYICIDRTHGTIGYNYQLVTVLVVDGIGQGFPCSFLISSRSDKEVISIFFEHVKDRIGSKINCRVLMTDMDDVFLDAWSEIMSPPKLRLYNTWKVDQDWRDNLRATVKTIREKQLQIYRLLRTLLEDTDENAFDEMFTKVCKSLSEDKEASEFAEFLINHYMKNIPCWSYCYQLDAGVKPSLHIERICKTIENVYLKSQRDKRLYQGISAIMGLVTDDCLERQIDLDKSQLIKKVQTIGARHITSLNMDFDLVISGDDGWNVLSIDLKESNVVQRIKDVCTCELHCRDCEGCLHQYVCSCNDSFLSSNMCKHIHLVCRHSENQDVTLPTSGTSDPINNGMN